MSKYMGNRITVAATAALLTVIMGCSPLSRSTLHPNCPAADSSAFRRFDRLARSVDSALWRVDAGRLVVHLVDTDSSRLPLDNRAVSVIVRRDSDGRSQTIRLGPDSSVAAGVYASVLAPGQVLVTTIRLGYLRHSDSVLVRRGYVDTLQLRLARAPACF